MTTFLLILISATETKNLAGIFLSAGMSLMVKHWLVAVFGIVAAMIFFAATWSVRNQVNKEICESLRKT